MSILKQIVTDMLYEDEKIVFLEAVAKKCTTPMEKLEEQYNSAFLENKELPPRERVAAAKMRVFYFAEGLMYKSSNPRSKTNPVAKNLYKFNKPKVEVDKKAKQKRGEGKYKQSFTENEEEPKKELFGIWNFRKNQWVGKPYSDRKRASKKADMLDNEYGAHSYQVKPIKK